MFAEPVFGGLGAERCYGAVAVCEEGGGEGGGGVEVLAEEEVAVVEGGGVQGYEEGVGRGGGGRDFDEGETVRMEIAVSNWLAWERGFGIRGVEMWEGTNG